MTSSFSSVAFVVRLKSISLPSSAARVACCCAELNTAAARWGAPTSCASAPVVVRIPADPNHYGMQPLEFKGDWMRARLKAPSDYCAEPDVKPAIREGWIRWRDARLGPLVWYYTRGC